MNGWELCRQMKQIGLPLFGLPPDGTSAVSYLQFLWGKTTMRIYTNLSCLFLSSRGIKALRKCSGGGSDQSLFKRKHNNTLQLTKFGVTGKVNCIIIYLYLYFLVSVGVDHRIWWVCTYVPPAVTQLWASRRSLNHFAVVMVRKHFTVPNDCWVNNCKIYLHYAAACPMR